MPVLIAGKATLRRPCALASRSASRYLPQNGRATPAVLGPEAKAR
jgi:hypothetical protein